MKNQPGKIGGIVMLMILLLGSSLSTSAQLDPLGTPDNTRRSIWDKEPEPKTDPIPFATTLQPATAGVLQQNGTLADPPGFGTNTQDGVPIDGGLSLLMAAGALFGAKKVYRKSF